MKTHKGGDIDGFPLEVVEWMLDQQEAQGNPRDVGVFEKDREEGGEHGGFWWEDAPDWEGRMDGQEFCDKVIGDGNFNIFFKRYPKKPEGTKRYCVTVQKYVLANDDEDAQAKATELANELGRDGLAAGVVSVVEHGFGEVGSREV